MWIEKEDFLQQNNLNAKQAHPMVKSSPTTTETVKNFDRKVSTSQIGNKPRETQQRSNMPINQVGGQQVSVQEPIQTSKGIDLDEVINKQDTTKLSKEKAIIEELEALLEQHRVDKLAEKTKEIEEKTRSVQRKDQPNPFSAIKRKSQAGWAGQPKQNVPESKRRKL